MKKHFNSTIMIFILFFILCFPVFLTSPDISQKNDILIGKNPSNINGIKKKKVMIDGFEDISQNTLPPKSSSFEPHPGDPQIREGYAILCGVSDYPGSDNDLQYCDDDANDLYNFVQSEFCIPEENIIKLIDSESTKEGISQAISNVSNVMDENDMLFFSYSGHGSADLSTNQHSWSVQSSHPYSNYMDQYWHYSAPGAAYMRVHFTRIDVEYGYDFIFIGDNDERMYYYDVFSGSYDNLWSYWVPCDDIYVNLYSDFSETDWGFRVDKVEVGYWTAPYNIIPYDGLDDGFTGSELDLLFDQVPGTSAVVLDSCFSGGVGNDLQDSSRYILSASEADEYSLEDSSRHNGLFTYQFLNVWDISLDSNLDGALTFQEIFPDLRANTVSRSSSLGYTHHPQEFDGVGHDVSFKPSANITSLNVNGTNENVIDLIYNLKGLGEGRLQFSTYDVDNKFFLTLNEIQNLTEFPWGNTIYKDIGGNVDGVSCILTSQYRDFIDISNSTLQMTPLQLNYTSDFDTDGLSDLEEFEKALNPWNNDTDFDGMGDSFEIQYDLDPYTNDSMLDPDFDNLTNLQEFQLRTDPQNIDSDDDGCPDGWEVNFGLDPTNQTDSQDDSDGDGLINGLEYQNGGNPLETDTDGDGLTDFQEFEIGTALNNTDTDGNGIIDAEEDNDGDNLSNIYEFQIGTSPLNPDSDFDGCPDDWEDYYNFDPLNVFDALDDPDGDGLYNRLEYQNGGNPLETDTDGDGLTDFQEYEIGTALNNSDTDGDGYSDRFEVNMGTNPLNPSQTPLAREIFIGIFAAAPIFVIIYQKKKLGRRKI
ncbi:MAG: caspase family protein [Promethearchaeota archaeon]